jgi:hypothetical protein
MAVQAECRREDEPPASFYRARMEGEEARYRISGKKLKRRI